jgi:hypothetical protein
MSARYVNQGLDGKRHIGRVVQQVLVGHFGICDLLKKALVLVCGDLTLISEPDCLQVVEDLAVQLNWVADELRELLNDLLDLSLC